ncbi:unnamed protein product [Trichogramma brassicae]|uniref:Uncharacterized protein n=1 Tax=Trichogramma brassicae TaxID=86971 RepID=A0A6H5IAT8_9HYME|nr:unnamed protein product [Trichogramma brassicae]
METLVKESGSWGSAFETIPVVSHQCRSQAPHHLASCLRRHGDGVARRAATLPHRVPGVPRTKPISIRAPPTLSAPHFSRGTTVRPRPQRGVRSRHRRLRTGSRPGSCSAAILPRRLAATHSSDDRASRRHGSVPRAQELEGVCYRVEVGHVSQSGGSPPPPMLGGRRRPRRWPAVAGASHPLARSFLTTLFCLTQRTLFPRAIPVGKSPVAVE